MFIRVVILFPVDQENKEIEGHENEDKGKEKKNMKKKLSISNNDFCSSSGSSFDKCWRDEKNWKKKKKRMMNMEKNEKN